ncbi:hypothetical protein SESBI_03083 [Sesbania bispinosa]|nr:hypothetical protein SESBI_03083 [Sesbania bispinosa]
MWLSGLVGDRTHGSGKGSGCGKARQQGMTSVGRGRGGVVKANATQVSIPGTSQTLQSQMQIEVKPMALVTSNGKHC